MNRVSGVIRTPDQRLRVFVSSTLKELAAERRAARAAIERLALAPVMFELGARPHPPRSLYRAYLEQSDIFVGIYWEQYGWVAPGEEVSGLEDEWNLAPDIPKLIYIKPSDHRQERLEDLLDRIRDDDARVVRVVHAMPTNSPSCVTGRPRDPARRALRRGRRATRADLPRPRGTGPRPRWSGCRRRSPGCSAGRPNSTTVTRMLTARSTGS